MLRPRIENLSELIEKLQDIYDAYGDMLVCTELNDFVYLALLDIDNCDIDDSQTPYAIMID